MPSDLFKNSTALLCRSVPSAARDAWVENGGSKATLGAVEQDPLHAIDVFLACWGVEDDIVDRLQAVEGVQITDESWLWDSLKEGKVLETKRYSFAELDRRSGEVLEPIPEPFVSVSPPMVARASTPEPPRALKRSPAPSPAVPPLLANHHVRRLVRNSVSPSPSPAPLSLPSASQTTEESNADEEVAAYLLPSASAEPASAPAEPRAEGFPASGGPHELPFASQIKHELSSPQPASSAFPAQPSQPHPSQLDGPAAGSPFSQPYSALPASLLARLEDISLVLTLNSLPDPDPTSVSGAQVVPAEVVLSALRAPVKPGDETSAEGEVDVRQGLQEVHLGEGGFEGIRLSEEDVAEAGG
ncbi:hypothetical protein JCM10213_005883 [Rhodosporidiobolus nylandii]